MTEPIPHPPLPPLQRRKVAWRLFLGVFLLILCGSVGFILSVNNIISSLWAGVFSAMFAAILGFLLSFVQRHIQSSSEPVFSVNHNPNSEQVQLDRQIRVRDVRLGVTRQRGAVVIYTGRRLRGSTVSLCKGFHANPVNVVKATNIAERIIDGVAVFAGIFPALEPGNYTVFDKQQRFISEITVYARCVTPVDWR